MIMKTFPFMIADYSIRLLEAGGAIKLCPKVVAVILVETFAGEAHKMS